MAVTEPIFDDSGDGGSGGTIGGGGTTPTPTSTPTPTPTPVPTPVQVLPAIVASSVAGGTTIAYDAIPLIATPSQTMAVQLGLQPCRINVYQKRTGLYLDLYVGGTAILTGVLCRDRVWLVRDAYLGFTGDLTFVDTQGTDDPEWSNLGSRYALYWGHA